MKNTLFPLIGFLLLATTLQSQIINVPDDYPSIQSAIDASIDGDVIMVSSGTYYVNNLFINKDISLVGEDRELTIIDGSGSNRIMTIESPGADTLRISNFTIQNGHALSNSGAVIKFTDNNEFSLTEFKNIILQNSGGGTGNTLFRGLGHEKTFYKDCIVRNNSAENAAGIGGSTVVRTVLYGNSGWNNTGVLADCDSYNCTVYNNAGGFMGNPWTVGGMTGGIATNCIFWDNAGNGGQQIYSAESVNYSNVQGGHVGEGNISNYPIFVDADAGDFTLQENSPCIDSGDPNSANDPDGTIADMGAFYFHQDLVIEILTPNGGEVYEHGDVMNITWLGEFPGTGAGIGLVKNGVQMYNIVGDVDSDTSYDWVIPESLEYGDDYQVRVYDAGPEEEMDLSDSYFSIVKYGCTDEMACDYDETATYSTECDYTSCLDCAGVVNGDSTTDECGLCDNDASNDCVQDCAGEWGGSNVLDE
ncbi:MAG: hypothetical protein P8L80_06770, partial [Flavobacteriales bacterium]|nr:hypothetical protein [Flavobacteriales bacterium]